MNKLLKGEAFQNRYRFTGMLRTLSPLHIGTGEESDAVFSESDRVKLKERLGKIPAVSVVMKDVRGKPIIPGSALRGVMRHWLLSVLAGVDTEWAATRNYEDEDLVNLTQEQQIQKVKSEFSWLEILFGTPFHEGKVEVWDAICLTESLSATDSLLNWNRDSLTFIDTSVGINPATGTAEEHLLYKTEVVPSGVAFDFNIVGQNLSREEIGLILLAMKGFNSQIYPIRLGARGGRGYGRMQFFPGPIYGLERENVKDWIKKTILSFGSVGEEGTTSSKFDGKDMAGHYALPQLSETEKQKIIDESKAAFNISS